MAGDRRSGLVRSIQTLYDAGSLAGLDDGELLGRFLAGGEQAEAAFGAIAARHGAMVYHVCRSLAGTDADAEDAFQAVFLVLACRAASVRRRGSLASWLFGVSRRVASRARANAARRRSHERRAAEATATAYETPESADDLTALIEEVDRLPSRYRDPIVLCHLQGLTYQAAATRLGCPLGTISVRLKRARERLRSRLERRGLGDSVAPLVALPRFAVPNSLAASTTRLALIVGPASHAGVPASVLTLTQGAMWTMRISKIIGSSAAFLALAVGVWAWRASAAVDEAVAVVPHSQGEPAAKPPGKYQLTGRVANPETREAAAGAVVQVLSYEPGGTRSVVKEARSGPDGTYMVELPPGHVSWTRLQPPPGYYTSAESRSLGVQPFALSEAAPVARRDFPSRRGSAWDFRLERGKDAKPAANGTIWATMTGVDTSARSGDDGAARLGLPPSRGEAKGRVEGPGTWTDQSLGFSIRWDDRFAPEAVRSVSRLEGATARYWLTDGEGRSALFEDETGGRIVPRLDEGRLVVHVAIPETSSRSLPEVVGTVVDREGEPVAGAQVEVVHIWGDESSSGASMIESDRCRTTADEHGRYRLSAIPDRIGGRAAESIRLVASGGNTAGAESKLVDVSGGEPVTVAPMVLEPGGSLVGTVVDADGKPASGAEVGYVWMNRLRDTRAWTDSDGRFRLDGLPLGTASIQVRYGSQVGEPGRRYTVDRDPEPVTIQLISPPEVDPAVQQGPES